MLGLIVLIVMGGYLALSIFLVIATYRSMKKKGRIGRKAWLPAVLVGLMMYLLVFWDHIPTIVAHKYYCDKYTGFTVYKTLEQWEAENPGVAKTLSVPKDMNWQKIENGRQIHINKRFLWNYNEELLILGIKKINQTILDKNNNQPVVKFIDFTTDIKNISLGARGFRDYKFWLNKDSCEGDVDSRINFFKYEGNIENLGRNE